MIETLLIFGWYSLGIMTIAVVIRLIYNMKKSIKNE